MTVIHVAQLEMPGVAIVVLFAGTIQFFLGLLH